MTTPQERPRALCWGASTLQQIASDASVSTSLVERATEVAATYPASEAIDDHVQAATRGFPPEWTAAFLDAGSLFRALAISREGTDETWHALRGTQRHYPDPGVIKIMSRQAPGFPWLPGPGEPLR